MEIEGLKASNFTAVTMTFEVSKVDLSTDATKAINIDGDFDEWYAANKDSLPFYAPPVPSEDEEGAEEEEFEEIEVVNEDGTVTK